ncbi:sugar-transfer associated ATP-grasp domain-containing protein [Daejeonella oryzae]|uniref:sugar-transfer associated ATP-grasp domain-containing protein n=1 Tax=Daejeonella oryzae TaxID=1122943 RepID=UPI0003FA0E22|nr:sugar-transfer associated ATP-grasp domain-containing protein [Daejeonella oryzae]
MKENLRRIHVFIKDPYKKGILVMIKDVVNLWAVKRSFPVHYFGRFLYRKDSGNCRDFLNMKEYTSIIRSKKLNNQEYLPLLTNKLSFALFCDKHKIPSPYVLSYNFKNNFFCNGKILRIADKQDLLNYFKEIFETGKRKKIFLKPLGGYGGKGIISLEYPHFETELDKVADDILQHSYIHQEGIDQHPEISKIYPKSVNTIRIDTYIDDSGKTHILGTAMRFGTGGKSVDNVSSGGFFVPVNSVTGCLTDKGTQAMKFGGGRYFKHPDSGFVFKDFEIPFFNEALKLCLDLSTYIPNRLAGWDIAITDKGPLVIEGNHTPYILMGEIAYGGYVKHPLYKELIANSK